MKKVWAEWYVVSSMDWCSLSAVICPSFACALTCPSMSHMTSLTFTLLANFVSYYRLTLFFSVTGNTVYRLLFVNQLDLESRTLACPVQPLHTYWRTILSHNLVTEIQKKLTRNKTDSENAFTRNTSSDIPIWLSSRLVTQEPSPCLRPDVISIW